MNRDNKLNLLKIYLTIATYFYFILSFKYPYTYNEYNAPAYLFWLMDVFFVITISVVLLLQKTFYKKVLTSIVALLIFLFIYNLSYTPFNYDLSGNLRLIKIDFLYILVILAITSYETGLIKSYFNYIVYLIIISNIIALILLLVDSSLVSLGDRFFGIVGGPKNWAFLILIPILYHLYNINHGKSRIIAFVLLPIEIYSLLITGSFTGYIGLFFSILIFMYLDNINKSLLLLKSALIVLITTALALLAYYMIGTFSLFETVKMRIDRVFLLYSNEFDLDLILSNPLSDSVRERFDQLNAVVSFFSNDVITVLFGNDIHSKYAIAEIYYFNLLTNKGLILTTLYISVSAFLLFKLIIFLKKFGRQLTDNERRMLLVAIPLLFFNVLIANFIESYSTRIPINIYYYSLLGITLGVMINFKRARKSSNNPIA